MQVEQYAGTRYVREMNSKTSSKAGGTADIKIIRPGIRLCIPGLFALRKILPERKIPLEDINYIIIEDNKTIITTRLLSEISKYFISLIICGF